MKGVFLVRNDPLLINGKTGISKKIFSQIAAFNNAGLECELYVQPDGKYLYGTFKYKIRYWLPLSNLNPEWKYDNYFEDLDFIYMRRPNFMSVPMRRFLKELKSKNPKVKVIVEIPTYPYDKEYKSLAAKILITKDKLVRKHFLGLIDRFACMTQTNKKEIWGIDTIVMTNGINLETVPLSLVENHKGINLLCVSSCEFWHGYERLIIGLSDYYKKSSGIEVNVHIVGNGPYLDQYKKIASEYNITEHVFFYGALFGEELDKIYSKCDISIGGLGVHRKGLSSVSCLKSGESFAKGLPFAASYRIDTVDKYPTKYFLKLPDDESPINVNDIVDFYYQIFNNCERDSIARDIREYAKQYFDINFTMKPVVEYIKSN